MYICSRNYREPYMKKNLLQKIFFLIILIIVAYSCDNKMSKFKKDNQLSFSTLEKNNSIKLDSTIAPGSYTLNINFLFPNTDNKELKKLFVKSFFGETYQDLDPEQAAKKYMEDSFSAYKEDSSELFQMQDELDEETPTEEAGLKSHDEDEAIVTNFVESISDSIVYNAYQVVSYKVTQRYMKDKRRGSETIRNFVIDLSTNSLMSLQDIFKDGVEDELHQLFINILLKQNNVESIDELEEYGYFGLEDLYPNDNFLVDNKGITFLYNRGEYSTMLINPIEIFIPYKDISTMLKPNTVVAYIASKS